MIPVASPYCLIQEQLWPNAWLILISSMMLNCTSRKQVERVLPEFMEKWPTPQTLMSATVNEIIHVISSLGFSSRRSKNILKMTRVYLCGNWTDPRELPGIGEYGARSYEIFCEGKLGNIVPDDGALAKYFNWRMKRDER